MTWRKSMPGKYEYGPEHTNSNVICAIDIRTGGPDPTCSDLLEVAFLPVDHSFRFNSSFNLFHVKIRPEWPVDKKYARLSEEKLKEYTYGCPDSVTARTRFEKWTEETVKLKKYKKIMPLVWDWSSIKPFIQNWLGSSFDDLVHESVRDMLSTLNFMNDRYSYWGEEVIFKHPQFGQLLARMKLGLIETNSVTANCMGLIQANHELMRKWIPGALKNGLGDSQGIF
jgi:hypothetical protein